MDPLAADQLDHALAELAQPDATPGEIRILGGETEDMALLGVGIETEQ
jgi:hypothetical protein